MKSQYILNEIVQMNKLKDTTANRSFIAFTTFSARSEKKNKRKCGKIEIKSSANGKD